MKYLAEGLIFLAFSGRTPHGVRGLKCRSLLQACASSAASHPSRGAWIEIRIRTANGKTHGVAPLTGCVD